MYFGKMKLFVNFLLLLIFISLHPTKADNEILSILFTAKDLTLQEVNALRPLFNELQKQYDFIRSAIETEGDSNIVPWQKEPIPEADIEEYVNYLESMFIQPSNENYNTPKYDTQLPSIKELIGNVKIQKSDLTAEQIAELEDMEEILQESLDETQTGINELVGRALLIESQMLKLNKPKIVTYIYKAFSILFRYSAQLRRAAYCVYSHVPQLNESLQNLNAGVECYTYTTKLVLNVQNEVVHTVGTIKKNIYDLAKVYKKIADKHSVVGKIITALLNIFKIMRDVRETLAVANKALDNLENQLPNAALKAVNCGTDFVDTLPFMLTTAVNVTTCITYIEPPTTEYEFLLPESERDFNYADDG